MPALLTCLTGLLRMAPRRQVAGSCLSIALILTAAVSMFGQAAAPEPDPLVATINRRLAEASEGPKVYGSTRAAVRGLHQLALSEPEVPALGPPRPWRSNT